MRYHARLARIPGVTPKSVLKSPLRFGVVLNDIEWYDSADWRDFSTIANGQRTQPAGGKAEKGRNLRTISLDVLTQFQPPPTRTDPAGPRWSYEAPYADSGQKIRQEVAEIVRKRAAFRLAITMHTPRITGSPAELRMNATLRSVTRRTPHGEADSRYLVLEFVEFRSAQTDERSQDKSDALPTTHKIEAGDTLKSLAKLYYKGQKQHWDVIKRANKTLLKGYGSEKKLDALMKKKPGTLRIPEPPGGGRAKPGMTAWGHPLYDTAGALGEAD